MFGAIPRVIPEIDEGETSIRVDNGVPDDQDRSTMIIREELLKWLEIAIAILLALLSLIICDLISFPLVYCVFPLIFVDMKVIFASSAKLRSQSIIQKRDCVKEIIDSIGSIVFKTLQLFYWLSAPFDFLFTLAPLAATQIFRTFFTSTFTHECHSFSTMFFFVGRWLSIFTLVSIGLNIDGHFQWSWLATLWPVWIGLCFMVLISLGVILLTIGAIFSYFLRESNKAELISTIWLFYSTSGSTITGGFCVFSLLNTSTSRSVILLIPSIFLFFFLIFSFLGFKYLLEWWKVFFITESEESGRGTDIEVPRQSLPAQIVTAVKKPPRALVRMSSTYFQPAESAHTKLVPVMRRTWSDRIDTEEGAETQLHRRYQSNAVPSPRMSLVKNKSHYVLPSADASVREHVCTMCCEKPCNAVIMECGHGGICYECSLMMWRVKGKCHMCREAISQVLQIALEPSKVVKVLSTTRAVYRQ